MGGEGTAGARRWARSLLGGRRAALRPLGAWATERRTALLLQALDEMRKDAEAVLAQVPAQ